MPQHSFGASASACATICLHSARLILKPDSGHPLTLPASDSANAESLPPQRALEVLDLVEGPRVEAAREVLPAVVGDDEDDVALVELAGDPHGDARNRARGDARED